MTKEELNEYIFTRSFQTANAYIGHKPCHFLFLKCVAGIEAGIEVTALGDLMELVERHHGECKSHIVSEKIEGSNSSDGNSV